MKITLEFEHPCELIDLLEKLIQSYPSIPKTVCVKDPTKGSNLTEQEVLIMNVVRKDSDGTHPNVCNGTIVAEESPFRKDTFNKPGKAIPVYESCTSLTDKFKRG